MKGKGVQGLLDILISELTAIGFKHDSDGPVHIVMINKTYNRGTEIAVSTAMGSKYVADFGQKQLVEVLENNWFRYR